MVRENSFGKKQKRDANGLWLVGGELFKHKLVEGLGLKDPHLLNQFLASKI
jgi:hypothetical protein